MVTKKKEDADQRRLNVVDEEIEKEKGATAAFSDSMTSKKERRKEDSDQLEDKGTAKDEEKASKCPRKRKGKRRRLKTRPN